MALEIERKFLVINDTYKDLAIQSIKIKQGYISRDPERTVRVRIKDDTGFITIKGPTKGAVREEFEYQIPADDAEKMMYLTVGNIIEKVRYIVPYDNFIWEVDEFFGKNSGLKIAEIELPDAEAKFKLPDFIGEDVTGKPAYYNSML